MEMNHVQSFTMTTYDKASSQQMTATVLHLIILQSFIITVGRRMRMIGQDDRVLLIPDNSSGRRETKVDDHFNGNNKLRNVSIDSVNNVLEEHKNTNLASRNINVNTANNRSTDKHRNGAAKSRSIGGKNLGNGTSNSIGFMVAEEEEMRAASCTT